MVCHHCRTPLPDDVRSDARYCTTSHRVAAYRRRRDDVALAFIAILELLEEDADDDAVGDLLATARELAVSAA